MASLRIPKRATGYVRRRMGGFEYISAKHRRQLMRWEIEQFINYVLGWPVDTVKSAAEYESLIVRQIKKRTNGRWPRTGEPEGA